MNPGEMFQQEVSENIQSLMGDADLHSLSRVWLRDITRHRYTYNFSWMGRPVIQLPQDLIAMQEIIWRVKPDLIIETGIAHGGSLVFYASILELLGGDRTILGIDVEIRAHNRDALETHPMFHRIKLLEGSSTDPAVIETANKLAQDKQSVLVILDSNHTHEHVLAELNAYSSLVTPGSYMVVFDTVIEDMPDDLLHAKNRPWGKGNNPKTAVWEFLKHNRRFQIDKELEAKLLLTTAPDGFLQRVGD